MTLKVRVGAPSQSRRRDAAKPIATAMVTFAGGLLDGLQLQPVNVFDGLPNEGPYQVRCASLPGFDERHPLAQAVIEAFRHGTPMFEVELDDLDPPARWTRDDEANYQDALSDGRAIR